MKAYGEVELQFHVFLALELVADEWSSLCSSRYTAEEMASR
jgi:hypothetical protein